MTTLTAICSDVNDQQNSPLVYVVEVPDDRMVPGAEGVTLFHTDVDMDDLITSLVTQQRSEELDVPLSPEDTYVELVFLGDLRPIFDWRF